MKKSYKNDLKLRINFNKKELNHILLNFLINSNCFNINKHYKIFYLKNLKNKQNKQFKKYNISKMRNHCLISYNTKSVHSKVKLSRWEFKKNASYGNLMGWRKSSW